MTERLLDREEYIEQRYFFRTFIERLADNTPSQEILQDLQEEILATTRLPTAMEFLAGEIKLHGRLSDGMQYLRHYFAPFQGYVLSIAEADRSKFDVRIALKILEEQAKYLSESPTPPGLFIYQFECIARNRLGYDRGLQAIADDPMYDEDWRKWILWVRLELGNMEFSEMLYRQSEHFVIERRRKLGDPNWTLSTPVLFGVQEGRIAKANLGRDPLYMFAALQRQLGYPTVPRLEPRSKELAIHPVLAERLKRIEQRLRIVELESQGKLDLSEFYKKPPDFSQLDDPSEPIG